MQYFALTLMLLVLAFPPEKAQSQASDSLLIALRSAYQRMDYASAEQQAYAILEAFDAHTAQELTEAHVTLGIIRFTQNELSQSSNHFEAALSLSPALELDARLISPKIRDFFQEIRSTYSSPNSLQPEAEVITRYVYVEDLRTGAALRSMVLPGWGQRYKQETRKGQMLTAGWVILAGSSIGTHLARSNAAGRYRAETDPVLIEERYDQYNRLHKVRNGLMIAAAGVWIGSYVDALWKKTEFSEEVPGLSLSVHASDRNARPFIQFSYSF